MFVDITVEYVESESFFVFASGRRNILFECSKIPDAAKYSVIFYDVVEDVFFEWLVNEQRHTA